MSATEKCCQCLNAFSIDKLPRKLPTCSHNICEPCLKEIIEIKQEMLICGFCAGVLRKEQIKFFPLNTALLVLINTTDPVKQPVMNEEDNQLLAEQVIEELCPTHKVLMDIACITDKHRICPHCALFGNHREHRFKRLEDFEQQISEKRDQFEQIQGQKRKFMNSDSVKIYQKMKSSILTRKKQLMRELELECERYMKAIKQAKQQSTIKIQQSCKQLELYFNSLSSVSKFEKSKAKFSKWEQSCLQTMRLLDYTPNSEERLSLYYDGPLEIVTQGLVFIDQINRYGNQALIKLQKQITQMQLSTENPDKMFQKCFFLKKRLNISPNSTQDKQEQPSEVNPFMDCTASQINLVPISILNTTTEAEFTGMAKYLNNEKPPRSSQTPKRQLASNKSVEKQKLQISAVLNKQNRINTPKLPVRRRTSELASSIVQLKLHKNLTNVQTVQQADKRQFKSPEKIYAQFSKNTLFDFFDISQCNLSSDSLVEYVHRARKVHKIRGLKLCGNHLTTAGFQKMLEFLQGVSNINMASNMISEAIFGCIIRNKEMLDSLKMLNLSHNPITLDKRASAKLQEVKKLGIVIVL